MSDPIRYGEPQGITSEERKGIFLLTWKIVYSYIKNI